MQALVDTYDCASKKAITTPETLRRFRHFVNSQEPDPNIQFVDERGQIRPLSRIEKNPEAV